MKNLVQNSSINLNQSAEGIYEQVHQNLKEQNEKQNTILEARDILGESSQSLTDEQVYDLVNEIQYLVDTWIEEYEKDVFDGKTLEELLQLKL